MRIQLNDYKLSDILAMGFKEKSYRPWPKGDDLSFSVLEQGKFLDLLWRKGDNLVYLGTVIREPGA
jgi:hypothetical protein